MNCCTRWASLGRWQDHARRSEANKQQCPAEKLWHLLLGQKHEILSCTPCSQPQGGASGGSSVQPAYAWGVEIATSFSKQEARDLFAQAKQDHADLLGSYDPMVVETCDLHMGTDLQYSVRIGTDSRDAADGLCVKLQAAGGACIVQKN